MKIGSGYDIDPKKDNIIFRDTINDFPKGYKVAITNPPYLAKNKASRMGYKCSSKYEDKYLDCLELIIANIDYSAVIIPSTFWNTGLFRNRLMAWDKIDYLLFNDTDTPVGVAYFGPNQYNTKIFVSGKEVSPIYLEKNIKTMLSFNNPNGQYVLSAIDKPTYKNIRIDPVSDSFNKNKYLKSSSRNYSLFYSTSNLDCTLTNQNITEWRNITSDFYLSSFKSLMSDGVYRKRLSFNMLSFLVKAVENKNELLKSC